MTPESATKESVLGNEKKLNAAPRHLRKRVKTPTMLQMEAVECGAAALASILGHFGRIVPLEELRSACGVSRDGSKASNILRAARRYGLVASGLKKESVEELYEIELPAIIFWNFNHFVVLEGFGKSCVYLNDPAQGPLAVSYEVFDRAFTGVLLLFKPGPDFTKGGSLTAPWNSLRQRLKGNETALTYVVLVSLFLVLPALVVPTLSKVFVDHFLVAKARDFLMPLLLGLLFAGFMRGGLTWLQQHYLLRLETKLALSGSSHFFWHVLRLPVVFFSQRFSGEIGARVGLNDQLAQILSGQLASTALNMVTLVFLALVMAQYSYVLTLLSVSIVGLNLLALNLIARRRKDSNHRLMQEQSKLTGTTVAGLQMIETLKATGGESDFFSRWSGYHAKTLNAQQQLGASSYFLNCVPSLLGAINQATILGFGGWLVMNGRMTLGSLVAFQSLASSFVEPVNNLMAFGSTLQTVDGSLRRLDDVLRNPLDPQAEFHATPETSGNRLFKLDGHLELRSVSFGYNPLEAPLLKNFSLSLKPGQRIALVGSTGCGKSTISKLVGGIYQPWEGQILFDGKIRTDYSRGVFANSAAMVDQEIFLFEGTIRENLVLWDVTVPEFNVMQAAKDACIHDEIVARLDGYDSAVEEGGRNFSGGQRQRLELARALVNNPSILILDEATSALDSLTEQTIDSNLRRRGCTCLVIAHRLSTIRDCDEIIVLERGKVVERGTHEELSALQGHYSTLLKE